MAISFSQLIRAPFTRLFAVHTMLTCGDWFFKISLPVFIYQMTGSASTMATAFALAYLPFLLFSLPGGLLADRMPRRAVLCIGIGAAFICIILIAFLPLKNNPFLLYVLVFLFSSINPLIHPVFQSAIPEVTDNAHLPRANSLISSADYFAQVLMPVLAGFISTQWSGKAALQINTVFFFFALVFVFFIPALPDIRKEAKSLRLLISEGLAYAWAHPVLKYGALLFIGSNFSTYIFQANLVFYLSDILQATPLEVGMVFAMTGISAIVGAILAPHCIRRFASGRIIVVSTICAGLCSALLFIADTPLAVGGAWALTMLCASVNVVTYFTLRQQQVPRDILGRTVAVTRLISYSSIPVAAALGGFMVGRVDFMWLIALCAGVRLLTGLFAAFSPLAAPQKPETRA